MKEGIPQPNKKLEKSGVGPGGYPEYEFTEKNNDSDYLSIDDVKGFGQKLRRKNLKSANDEVFVKDVDVEGETIDLEIVPNKLSVTQRKKLREVLLTLGLSLLPMKGAGVDATLVEDNVKDDYSYSHSMDGQNQNKLAEEVNLEKENINDYTMGNIDEYSSKLVLGTEDVTRYEYLRDHIKFTEKNEEGEWVETDALPPIVEQEIRNLMPGLCAQESRFVADAKSKVGAIGLLQIMPDTWKQFEGERGKETSMLAQAEVAGRFIADTYKQLSSRISEADLLRLKSKFDTEEAFQVDFMVPLVINSYNAGPGRVLEAVEKYLDNTKDSEMPEGKDLYVAIADFAFDAKGGYLRGYGPDSRDYVKGVYAFADKLREMELDKKMTQLEKGENRG